MPTESQVVTWITNNWPTVAVAVSAGTVYVVAYLRLHAFLSLVANLGKQTAKLKLKIKALRSVAQELVASHCSKYPLETKDMMELLKEEEPDDGDVS